MSNMLIMQCFSEEPVAIAGAVVGEYAADGEAEAGIVGAGHEEEADGRLVCLIGQDSGEADARVIVDGDMQILPSGAAGFPSTISVDAMARLDDPGQALDIEVDQIAGMFVFIANHGRGRIE